MIAILDSGMGNTASILNMIRRVGGEAIITADLDDICDADAIILPGVGAFDSGIERLVSSGIHDVLQDIVLNEKKTFLGICLGMQLLFESSEEGDLKGLGWIPGEVKRFNFDALDKKNSLKVPHMGWNIVNPKNHQSLYRDLEDEARFYFVHSYHAVCENSSHVLATATYGYEFACSVNKENIWGAQFHPEKSHKFGMTFFRNFLEQIKC